MGDITPTPTNAMPAIMLVRPSLHNPTPSNASIFKRWTTMHFNDLLNCPSPSGTKGITRALRYTNPDGSLLYTIHSDNIAIWQTLPYYAVSRRLDLENTRVMEKGESAVLQGEHGFEKEAMVWDVCDAKFGIFECEASTQGMQSGEYHDLPLSLLSPQGQEPGAPGCELITLTYSPSPGGFTGEGEDQTAPSPKLMHIRDRALESLNAGGLKVYTSIYRHRPDAQPDNHPLIEEGAHGNGPWVMCMFVEGHVDEAVSAQLRSGIKDVKVGVWKGEVLLC